MRRIYWWLVTFSGEAERLVVMGPYLSDTEARRVGIMKLGNNFQIFELETIDKAKATGVIKHKLFEQTGDLERALKRARHTVQKEG